MRIRDDRPWERLGEEPRSENHHRPAGAVVGVVTNNNDPEGMGRVRVRFPWLDDGIESHWARIAQPYAGPGRGSFWLPEIGDEVAVVFDRADPNHPYVLGGLWNGEDGEPEPGNSGGKNDFKIWRTRSGHRLVFEDTEGGERLTLSDGPGKRHVVIDVAANSITVTASPGDITFEAPRNTLTIDCKDLEFEVSGSSAWRSDGPLSESSSERQETIALADTVQVSTTWNLGAPSTSLSAAQMSLAAQTMGVAVAGALSLQNAGGRNVSAKEVRRTTASVETLTAGSMDVSATEALACVSNGPITLNAAVRTDISARDATITTTALLCLQGGMVKIQGTAALALTGELVQLC